MQLSDLIKLAEENVRQGFIFKKAGLFEDIKGSWYSLRSDIVAEFGLSEREEKIIIRRQGTNFEVSLIDKFLNLNNVTTKLTKKSYISYPSIDDLFHLKSPIVEKWLSENNWNAEWEYNNNFKDPTAKEYIQWHQLRNPFYNKEVYAVEGGYPFHAFGKLEDMKDDDVLILKTLKESEPFINIVRNLNTGTLRVIAEIS